MLEYMHAYQILLIQAIYLEGVLIYFECPIYDKKNKLNFDYFIQFLSSKTYIYKQKHTKCTY
jgi:hypothetical protein